MKLSSSGLRILLVPVQVGVSFLILYLLFSNVNLGVTIHKLSQVNLPLLLLSVAFFIFSSLAIGFGLHGALKAADAAPSMGATQFANFGGQLLSDITPAKSGYFATPVLLNQLKAVPLEKGLMSVLSVGAVNFFIKAAFSGIALFYFLNRITVDAPMTNAMLLGITILIASGVGLAVLVWTNRFRSLFLKIARLPVVGNLIQKLCDMREMFSKDKASMRKSVKVIVASVIASIFFSGISLVILAHAMGLIQPTFVDLLLMGPLTAVFMYVPVTFAGLGLQETAYVFLLTNIGASIEVALPFAILIRVIAVTTDLIGLPSLIKTSTGVFSRLKRSR